MTKNNTPRILIVFGLIIVLLSMVGTAFAQADSSVYPLYDPQDGHQYVADIGDDRFDAEWTQDGRLWQPNLPDKQVLAAMEEDGELKSFTVAFKLVEGEYLWSGVECELRLDPERTGTGGKIEYVGGNAKTFDIEPAPLTEGEEETLPVAWASATCNGHVSTGFEILAMDYSSDAPADPASTPEPKVDEPTTVPPEATLSFEEKQEEVCTRPGASSFVYDGAGYNCPTPEPEVKPTDPTGASEATPPPQDPPSTPSWVPTQAVGPWGTASAIWYQYRWLWALVIIGLLFWSLWERNRRGWAIIASIMVGVIFMVTQLDLVLFVALALAIIWLSDRRRPWLNRLNAPPPPPAAPPPSTP